MCLNKINICFIALLILFFNRIPLASAQDSSKSLTSILQSLNQVADGQNESLLSSIGIPALTNFSWINFIGGLIFGSIGFVYFVRGKKQREYKPLVIGIILMGYPYFITNTFWLYAAGVGLCGLLYYWRD